MADLARHGYQVPAGFGLKTRAAEDFYRMALPPEAVPAKLAALPPSSELTLSQLRETLEAFPMPELLRSNLEEAQRALLDEGATALAVRSSSTAEDSVAHAAAGAHETFLGVSDAKSLHDAVRRIWGSLYVDRVFGYTRAAADEPPGMGVLVQRHVHADVAGVMFTANPMTGDASEIVINASYGLGTSVVAGQVAPDTVRVDKASSALRERVVGSKATREDLKGGKLVRSEVPEDQRAVLCLSDAQIEALSALALRLEETYAAPQDIEWAIEGDTVWLLQSRAITTELQPATRRWKKRSRTDRTQLVWSNVNVGEALPGVATPLTWSILSAYSERGFRQAFGALGCSVPSDAELVGAFRGRIYLNLTEFVSILSAVPGIDARSLLALGGGTATEALPLSATPSSFARRKFLARLPLTVARFARDNLTFDARLEEFEHGFRGERARTRSLDLRVLSNVSLSRTLNDAARLLDESGSLMLTAYGSLLACLMVLTRGLNLLGHETDGSELLTGLADLESAAPGASLWHIAAIARDDAGARAALERGVRTLRDLPEGPTKRALETFMEAYGHRGPREGELYEPRWRDDPSIVLSSLRMQLETPARSPVERERAARDRRDRAWAELRLPAPAAAAFRRLLALTRRQMRLRERLRDYVTDVLGFYRRIAVDASRRMGRDDAAFFLTESELHGFLLGRGADSAQLQQRRRRYERDRSLPDPPATFVGYPGSSASRASASDTLLRGLSVSGGTFRGRVRRLDGDVAPSSLQPGDVLVLATADVGLSPLFLSAGAVVTELGGPLSHAAIVLREYSVPAVFNVRGARLALKDGDEVEVDGDSGLVHVLTRG